MTQEHKDLLLKDLCARLPYGVKVDVINEDNEHHIVKIGEGNIGHLGKGFWKECKPYLFPLSSMTEEQYNEMQTISGKDCMEHMEIEKEWRNNSPFTHLPLYQHRVIEFFHKYHFDYRGLISMELAIDATGLNIY